MLMLAPLLAVQPDPGSPPPPSPYGSRPAVLVAGTAAASQTPAATLSERCERWPSRSRARTPVTPAQWVAFAARTGSSQAHPSTLHTGTS
eukprot:COSAG01_NODE_2348_length_7857_cov_4.460299_2_plen_90_part_00